MTEATIRAWNIMGGEIVWPALPAICEMLGVSDPEALILRLVALRDNLREIR